MRGKSLKKKAYKVFLTWSVILMLLIGMVGFVVQAYAALRNYYSETGHIKNYLISLIGEDYIASVFERTKELYFDTPEEVRSDPDSEAYLDVFSSIYNDDHYHAANEAVRKCQDAVGASELALVFFDEENSRMVEVFHADRNERSLHPGYFETYDTETVKKWINKTDKERSGWVMSLDHTEPYGFILSNFVELRNKNGDIVIGHCYSDINIGRFLQNEIVKGLTLFPWIILLVFVTAALSVRYLNNMIIVPINELSRTAEEYGLTEDDGTDEDVIFFDKLNINTGDEIELLWKSLSGMEMKMNETLKKVRSMTAEKEKVNAEFDMAYRIQRHLLPGETLLGKGHLEFDLFAILEPAKEVGGDFYDYFPIGDDRFVMLIADVSGIGLPAALFMVRAITMIKYRVKAGGELSKIAEDINNYLVEGNHSGMFVTMWIVIVETATGRLKMVNAGHMDPIVKTNGRYRLLDFKHYPVLGAFEDIKFGEDEFMLNPGDCLFFYTDGVTDAENRRGDFFGPERLLDSLNQNGNDSIKQVLLKVRNDISCFTEGEDQDDDITMLGFEYLG